MLGFKKSKVKRMRGTSSHGWGHKKKHRGKGHRGGMGLSGTGARGDAKKSALLSDSKSVKMIIAAQKGVKVSSIKLGKSYFGKKGFKSISKSKVNTLSLNYIQENLDKLVEMNKITKDGDSYVFNGEANKVDKILGRTSLGFKLVVEDCEVSASARQKIEEAGGSAPSEDDFE